jgi:ornithine cyclodeaminase/alanine dehydrogenase-like protein (mu-crystallin family)
VKLWANYFHIKKTLLLEEHDITGIVRAIGLTNFLSSLIIRLEQGFRDFSDGKIKVPARHEFFFDKGTIESMPCADSEYFAVKLINTHADNPSKYNMP